MQTLKVGDVVRLRYESPSAIGYNGVICKIKIIKDDRYFCESVYGTARVWATRNELIPQNIK